MTTQFFSNSHLQQLLKDFYGANAPRLNHAWDNLIGNVATSESQPSLSKWVTRPTKLTNDESLPAIGELLPILLADLAQVEENTANDINLGWLALYWVTVSVDSKIDGDQTPWEMNPVLENMLTAKGILALYKHVADSKYANAFEDVVGGVATGELNSVSNDFANRDINLQYDKAIDKNRHIMLAAYAISANCDDKLGSLIVKLSESLLLPVQMLDDLSDFQVDYQSKRLSTLITNLSLDVRDNSKFEIIRELIKSGSLLRFGKKLEATMVGAINKQQTFAYELLQSVLVENQKLQELLSNVGKDVSKKTLHNVERQMSYLCLSS